jgi:hypothetical protein
VADRIVLAATTTATVVTGRVIGATRRRASSSIAIIGCIVGIDTVIVVGVIGIDAVVVIGIVSIDAVIIIGVVRGGVIVAAMARFGSSIVCAAASARFDASIICAAASAHFTGAVIAPGPGTGWRGQGYGSNCREQRKFECILHGISPVSSLSKGELDRHTTPCPEKYSAPFHKKSRAKDCRKNDRE